MPRRAPLWALMQKSQPFAAAITKAMISFVLASIFRGSIAAAMCRLTDSR